MKLAIISDEIDQDFSKVIKAVQTCKFEGVEVRSVWNTRPDELSSVQLTKIRTILNNNGVTAAGFDSPVFKTNLPLSDKDLFVARENFKKAVNQARCLNSSFLRVFTFYRENAADPIGAAEKINEIISGIIPNDIKILIENGMRTNTPTMEHMLMFLDRLGETKVGVLWDPGNSVFAGFNPNSLISDYKLGKDFIKHIHVKDPNGQIEYVKLGEGDVPWKNILSVLLEDGYSGWLSLETHWRKDRRLSQDIRDNPWYENFSKGGYDASIESMNELSTMLGELQ